MKQALPDSAKNEKSIDGHVESGEYCLGCTSSIGGTLTTNHGASTTPIELWMMNAGQGAFNWVKNQGSQNCGGWIFDCGTMSGARKIERSIQAVVNQIRHPPAMILVSHYHKDHISHLETLANELRFVGHPSTIWIPEIDQYSMGLYLKILAFGTLFRRGPTVTDDRELTRLFAKRDHLAGQLRKWYPDSDVREVGSGRKVDCPCGPSNVSVLALTPPRRPSGRNHPLLETIGTIWSVVRNTEVAEMIQTAADQIYFEAREDEGFSDFINIEFGGGVFELLDGFGGRIVESFGEEVSAKTNRSRLLTRLLLAASSFTEKGSNSRIDLSRSTTKVPTAYAAALRKWPATIKEATHLFNLAVLIKDGERNRFLLTGDADNRLWPEILNLGGTNYDVIQVPHHGSEENVLWDAYEQVQCQNFLVSADGFSSWRHPSQKLVSAIGGATNGSLFCTNAHRNCEPRNGSCCGPPDIVGVSASLNGVFWLTERGTLPAIACPRV